MLSYLPFVWHPLVFVHDPGDTTVPGTYTYLAEGQLVEREVFAARNLELALAHAKLAIGERSNPVYFQPPHAVGFASPCTAFGHRELFAALEAYGLARMKVVG